MTHSEDLYLSMDGSLSKRWTTGRVFKVGAALISGACVGLLATSILIHGTSPAASTNLIGMPTLSRPSSMKATAPGLSSLPSPSAWKELANAACDSHGVQPTPRFTAALANMKGKDTSVMLFGFGKATASTKTLPKKAAPKKAAFTPKKAATFTPGSKKTLQPLPQGTGYGSWEKDDRVGAFPPFGYWDPLGLSVGSSEGQKAYLREAELKHGRVCMLASLGFIVAERYHPFFGGWDGPALLAPADPGTTLFWPAFLGLTGGIELLTGVGRSEGTDDVGLAPALKEGLTPGDIGWDPLGFKGRLEGEDWKNMQDRELAHARLGMIATLGLILQELITGEKSFGA